MNPAFLVFANVVLLARLFVLFKDDASTGRSWLIKTAVEVAALAAFYPCSIGWLVAAAVVSGANLLGWRREIRSRQKNLSRLLLGIAEAAALSICFVPGLGVAFRPELARLAASLGEVTVLEPLVRLVATPQTQLALLGLLLAGNEANLVIRAGFDLLDLKPRSLPAGQGVIDVREFSRGRVIGLLERVLLYLFILQGQYGAIGFVLAAKAFTRFKALDDRPFAEYVLIGTLLSACLALAAGDLVRHLGR